MLELACFKPMEDLCVNCCGFLCCKIRSILQIVVLSLLLGFQVQPRQASKILLADGLVDCGTTSDTFAIVISGICPPVGLSLHVANNHVLDGDWQAWNLPWDVGLPAAPGFTQVLQNCLGLVRFDAFWHHVIDVLYDG